MYSFLRGIINVFRNTLFFGQLLSYFFLAYSLISYFWTKFSSFVKMFYGLGRDNFSYGYKLTLISYFLIEFNLFVKIFYGLGWPENLFSLVLHGSIHLDFRKNHGFFFMFYLELINRVLFFINYKFGTVLNFKISISKIKILLFFC